MKTERERNTGTALLRLPTVISLTGLQRDSIYRLAKKGEFPKPRKLTESGRSSAWRADEIAAWIESRPVAGGEAA